MNKALRTGVRVGGVFTIICYGSGGQERWADRCPNLVTNGGLNYFLDVAIAGSAQTATWYAGLAGADPVPAAGDTLASHAGWTEVTNYTGDRQEYVDVRTDQTVSNTASKAAFPISTAGTVGGAFLAASATASTGTVLCAAALTASNRSVIDGDTISLTYTLTAADA